MNILEDALNRILCQLNRHNLPIVKLLQKGLSRQEIQIKLKDFPLKLPNEIYRFYQWRNGVDKDRPLNYEFFPEFYILSLDEALIDYDKLTSIAQQIAQKSNINPSLIWNHSWFPIFRNIGGDYFVILCDKKEKKISPVYFVFKDDRGSSYMAYDSLTSMILTIAKSYETEAYKVNNRGVLQEDPQKVAKIIFEYNPKRTEKIIGKEKEVDILIQFLKHKDGRIREKAAKALILLKDERAVEFLIQTLEDENPGVRALAARILGEIRDPRAVDVLIRALRDQNSYVRMEASVSLGYIADTRAVEPLISAMRDVDVNVRSKIAWALGELKSPKAVEILIHALKEENGPIRISAAKALGEIKDTRAVKFLIHSLRDKMEEVRQLSAWSLGELGDLDAIEPLSELLHYKDEVMKKIAQTALEKISKRNNEN